MGSAAGKRQEVARPLSDELREEVEARLRFGRTVPQIEAELEALAADRTIPWAPRERTIRSWVAAGKVRRPTRPDDPWSLLTGAADDVALVMPVVPSIAALPRSVRWLSVREAEVIARVCRAAPGIRPAAAATLAVLYVERERLRKPTTDLDLYVALRPWEHGQHETEAEQLQRQQRYATAAEAAGVPRLFVSTWEPGFVIVGLTGYVTLRQEKIGG